MARPKTAGPTDRELEILQVLWERGLNTSEDVFWVLDQKSKTVGKEPRLQSDSQQERRNKEMSVRRV